MNEKALFEIAAQLKRIADAMERQEKRDFIQNGGTEKIREAIDEVKQKKNELLRDIKNSRNS